MRRYLPVSVIAGGILAVFTVSNAFAQGSGGQFCVRSYEDTNSNTVFDSESERLVTRGISVELLDQSGIIVGSALLDRSPNASQGIVCFYNLREGSYSVLVSSADYIATSDRLVTKAVQSTSPTIVEFGARRLSNTASTAGVTQPASGGDSGPGLTPARVIAATVASAVVMVIVLIVGFLVYGIGSRRGNPRPVTFSPDSVQNRDPMGAAQPGFAAPTMPEPPRTLDDTNPTGTSS
jgi:hypothetical protein